MDLNYRTSFALNYNKNAACSENYRVPTLREQNFSTEFPTCNQFTLCMAGNAKRHTEHTGVN